jgi:hypothetical protein
MRLVLLALVLFATSAIAAADAVTIKNRRPSYLLAVLDPSAKKAFWTRVELLDSEHCALLPKGVVLQANDEKGEITVSGPADGIDKAKAIIAAFDVKPRQVTISAKLSSRLDKYEATTTTQVDTGTEWTFRDGTLGIEVTIKPRINGDGTVTGHVSVADGSSKVTLVGRQNVGLTRQPDGSFQVVFAREDEFLKGVRIDLKFEISN